MPDRCVAGFCSNTREDGVSLFRFPKDPILLQKWIQQVQQTREKWSPSERSLLCCAHFSEDCFSKALPLREPVGIAMKFRKKLLPDAVPTVFNRRRCCMDKAGLEVAVQWECPEGPGQEVGHQSQKQRLDVGVQVDLIGLSFTKPGSGDVLWRCASVKGEESGGGVLWRCCLHSALPESLLCLSPSEPQTRTNTKAPIKTSDLNQSSLSLSSMPSCGHSPSSSSHDAPQDTTPDMAHPIADTAHPAPDTAHPTPDTAHPAPDTAHPAPDTAHPAPDTAHPVPDTAHPAPDTAHPVPDTAHPAPDTAHPVPDTAHPAPDTARPVPDTARPVPDIAHLTPDTAHPTADMAHLTPETAHPTPEMAHPIPETAHPTPETAHPTPEMAHLTSVTAHPIPEEALEALGYMAPLSSDEEDAALSRRDERLSGDNAQIKLCRAATISPPDTSTRRRNHTTRRQACLPLRYQLDYDLESHDTKALQEMGADESLGPGCGRDDGQTDMEELFLLRYKQSLGLGEITESQYRGQQRAHSPRERGNSTHSPRKRKSSLHVLSPKLKKDNNKSNHCLPAVDKTRGWMVENMTIKEGQMNGASGDLERTIKEETHEAFLEKTANWFNYTMIEIKQEEDSVKHVKQQKQSVTFSESNVVKREESEECQQVGRQPGQPRQFIQLKQGGHEPAVKPESGQEWPASAEQTVRPRRKDVGPPLRYLLECEDICSRRPARESEPVKVQDTEEGHFVNKTMNGRVATLERNAERGVLGSERLKLGDVCSGQTAMVKKVKILNSTTERADKKPFLSKQWSQSESNEASKRRRRGRTKRKLKDKEIHVVSNSKVRQTEFLVYRNRKTGRATLISPCYVQLQQLKDEDRNDWSQRH